MKIVMIGTGNVATIFTRKFAAAGHQVLEVAGRSEEKTRQLAEVASSTFTTDFGELNQHADIYILAVNDDALEQVCALLDLDGKFLVHTAGAVSRRVLEKSTPHNGVFYPLQTITGKMDMEAVIPIHVDANDEQHLALLKQLASSITTHVVVSGDEERLKLHTAAVCCNNFTNYLYTLASDFCIKEKLNFDHLLPLVQETSRKLNPGDPWLNQTGPAKRHDDNTIQKHLSILQPHQEFKEVYEFLTSKIKDRADFS